MKLAILYATKYGSTREVAEEVARLAAESGVDRGRIGVFDLAGYSAMPDAPTIILGAPIYGGTVPRSVRRFLDAHLDELLERRVGIFLSCLYGEERAEQQLADNFPARLVAHSYGRYYVGGRVKVGQLRWLDKQIMKGIGGVSEDVDRIDRGEIARLARDAVAG